MRKNWFVWLIILLGFTVLLGFSNPTYSEPEKIVVDCGNCPKCGAPGYPYTISPGYITSSLGVFAVCRDAYLHQWLVRLY